MTRFAAYSKTSSRSSKSETIFKSISYLCTDNGQVPGKIGSNVERFMYRKFRKDNLWPIQSQNWSEEDLFDLIEFLYDHISVPSGGNYHEWNDCGMHYSDNNSTFDSAAARLEFRNEINEVLSDYSGGFELSDDGEILVLPERGLEGLLANSLPHFDPENVELRVDQAIRQFRRQRSSVEERKAAVRELADVLEFLRPQVKTVMDSKDESDLFNIANNFGIRHHNSSQKTNYDADFWLPWMFYYNLAFIHVAVRLIKRRARSSEGEQSP